MFISKKKYEEAIKEAECRVSKHYEDERCRFEEGRYQSERINDMWNAIHRLERQVEELKGIKEKYDKVCEAVNAPNCGW